MLVFLAALRHPDNAVNFSRVEQLLDHTLHSLSSQTDEDFRVVIVCNRQPQVTTQDERIHFHVVDFPCASKDKSSALSAEPKFKDKGTKYLSGLLYAKRFNPDHVYIVDSDDWFNIDIAKTLKAQPAYPVWYINHGYFVNYQLKETKRKSGLSRYCGSTFIYDYSFLMEQAKISKAVDEHSSQDELIEACGEFFVTKLLSNHTINYRHFRDLGYEPKCFPLRTACWVQNTGENVSGCDGGSDGIPIDQHFVKQFGLPKNFVQQKRSSLVTQFREWAASLYSEYTWQRSKRAKHNVF